nr:5'-nucleotidase C-terminal domain-containing protein [Verrucomicrobiota bacterium JB025]
MKLKSIWKFAAASPVLAATASASDLVVTGVIDGPLSGGIPKAIEVYVVNDIPDLAIYGVGTENGAAGGGTEEFTFPAGSATAGDFLYLASESTGFSGFFGFAPDYTDSSMSINGDDSIEIFKNGVVIDTFGDVNADGTGTPWEYLDGWAYRSSETGPDGTAFSISNWSFSGINALDGETTNAAASTPFPLASYAQSVTPPTPSGPVTNLVQAIPMGVGSGEVVAHSMVGGESFIAVTDNPNGGVSIFKWIDANRKYQLVSSVDISSYPSVANFDQVSSVALDPRGTGLGVAAVQTSDPASADPDDSAPQLGYVVFFNVVTGAIVGHQQAGYHPDMAAIGENGWVAVANEAEYAWNEDSESAIAGNQNGSVSLYDLSAVTPGSFAAAASPAEVEIDFTHTPLGGLDRYNTPEEIEPEYIAFDGNTIFVGCQESNAIMVLPDVTTATSTSAFEAYALGTVSYTTDASDKDDIDISDVIKGMHMPDAIAVYQDGGKTYLVTADEGDARPDDSDITRAGDFASTEDDLVAATPDYDAGSGPLTQAEFDTLLQDEDALGRIDVLIDQSTNSSGELTDVVGLGTRGISVWEYTAGSSLTRISHLPLESFIAANDPATFNSNDGGDPGEMDKRSDNKGPEPEAVTIVDIAGTKYAFVGNERQNSVILVDLSDPANPLPLTYNNQRDNGLLSPETTQFIPAAQSPTGEELAIVGYEGLADDDVAGGIGIYSFAESRAFTLTLLHHNDGESSLVSYNDMADYGNVARFKTAMDTHGGFYENLGHGVLKVFAGDSFLAGKEFQASLDSDPQSFYDALALSRIGYDAGVIGNHEFDFGPDTLAGFIAAAQTVNPLPFLSANLDFSGESGLDALVNSGDIAKSLLLEVPTASGVKKVGIIGATTENLPFISSPGAVSVSSVATAVNSRIATLQSQGADAIILVSHLQGISEDDSLVPNLNAGLSLIIAGGGDELLGDASAASPRDAYGSSAPGSIADTGLIPGDGFADLGGGSHPYPFTSTATDLGGNHLPIVTTADAYGYLGRVTLSFDAAGNATVDPTSNPAIIVADTLDAANGYALDSDVASDSVDPVSTYVTTLDSSIIGTTNALMAGGANKDIIRAVEAPVGNLVADAYLAKARELAPGFGVSAPEIALPNGGGIRADIPAGDISLGTTFSVSPFGNFVAVVENVTSADLKLLLENCYSQTIDADPGNHVNPQRSGDGTGRFAQIAGMDVVYDISRPAMVLGDGTIESAGARVISAILNDGTVLIAGGVPVAGETVSIALPAFNASGGDQFFRYEIGGSNYYTSVQYPYTTLGVTDQQALADYITAFDHAPVDADARYDAIADDRIVAISDRDSDGLQDLVEAELGTNPDSADELDAATLLAAIAAKGAAHVQTGESNVINDPNAYDLYSEDDILNLEVDGVMGSITSPGAGGQAVIHVDIYSSDDMRSWNKVSTVPTNVDAPAGQRFFRLAPKKH